MLKFAGIVVIPVNRQCSCFFQYKKCSSCIISNIRSNFNVKYKNFGFVCVNHFRHVWFQGINLEIRIRKFRWVGHTLRKEDGEITKAAVFWNPRETGREEDRETAGEDR